VKYCLPFVLCCIAAAQSAIVSTYTTDINGRRVEASSVATSGAAADHTTTERSQSINGREVPLEKRETKILRQDSSGSVTETIIRKYTPNGELSSTERVVSEENKSTSGSNVRSTSFRSDINGQMQETERKTVETRIQGLTTSIETVVDRPSLNGSFETAEKRSVVKETSPTGSQSNETVYRRSTEGRLYEALRQVNTETVAGNQVTGNTAIYELNAEGNLRLARQQVSTTTKKPDGSEVSEVNLYGRAVDGIVQDNSAPQMLKEQQIIERRKGNGGAVIETLSVRRPTISDPNRLGAVQKISETVCRGDCAADAPAKP
jgi:hypothetical protein